MTVSYHHYYNLPILQMRKLRHRVSERLICGHKVGLWHGHCLKHLAISSIQLSGLLESSLELWRVGGQEERQKSSIFQKGTPYPLPFIPGRAIHLLPCPPLPPTPYTHSNSSSSCRQQGAKHPLQEMTCAEHPWSQHSFIKN